MTEQLFMHSNKNFQSKFSLKKKDLNVFPKMKLITIGKCNRRKEEISHIQCSNDKEENGVINSSDFNIFYNQLQMKSTIKSNRTIDTTSFDNKKQFPNRMMKFNNQYNNIKVKSKDNSILISLRDQSIKGYSNKTQNNSLSKNTNQIILKKNIKGLKIQDKPLKLKVSLGNQVPFFINNQHQQYPHQKIDLKVANQQFKKNLYPLNTFTNTQPSLGNNNNNAKAINGKLTQNNNKPSKPLQPIRTLKLNTISNNQRLENDDFPYKQQEKKVINTDSNRNEIDLISSKLNKSDTSIESEDHSDALEYDEVKDIIIYHDFYHLSKHNDHLFKDNDYNDYISQKKDSYLQFFNINHKNIVSPINNLELNMNTIKGLSPKSISLVKVTI